MCDAIIAPLSVGDDFAKRAGFASWAIAIDAMKSGKILSACRPRQDKTLSAYRELCELVKKNGLLIVSANEEFDLIFVGFFEYFPQRVKDRLEIEWATKVNPTKKPSKVK